MNKIPIIIDCDPGHDDAVALILAFAREELDVKAVTVVAGNQTVDKTLHNAKRILSFIGKHPPVAAGAARPLVRELVTAPLVHGESGLDGVDLLEPDFNEAPVSAAELLRRTIMESPEPITLVPTGPLTNIAFLFSVYPEVLSNIRQISMMGGGIATGNWNASAEFNIFVDPEAADIVFNSGLPITMAPLDLTHKALILPEEVEELRSTGGRTALLVSALIDFYSQTYRKFGFPGSALHDPCAVAWLVKPEIFSGVPYHIDIETSGKYTAGMTLADRRPWATEKPNAHVLVDLDRRAFIEMIFDTCKFFS